MSFVRKNKSFSEMIIDEMIEQIQQKAAKESKAEKIYITNVKFNHPLPLDLFGIKSETPPEISDLIARSQFKTMQTILAHPGFIVVCECLYENATPEKLQELLSSPFSLASVVRMFFKNGVIPDTYDELTEVQKLVLSEHDGAMILFFLGKITHIYKSQTEAEWKLIEARIRAGDMSDVMAPREILAINWCKQAAKESGNNQILLLFGAAHNFKERIALLNDPGVVFGGEIDTRKLSSSPARQTMGYEPIANKGITICDFVISDKKKEDYCVEFKTFKTAGTKSFVYASAYDGVPEKLQFIINSSSISKFLDKGLTTLDQLIQYYHCKPYVLDALRSCNFIEAVNDQVLTVDQIAGLTKAQVVSLLWAEEGGALKAKVEEFLKLNQKQQYFYSSQRNVNLMFASAVLFNRMQREQLLHERQEKSRRLKPGKPMIADMD